MGTQQVQQTQPVPYPGSTQSVPCNLCGSADYRVLLPSNAVWTQQADVYACTSPHIARHGRVVRCTRCGLVYASPRPTPAVIERLYSQVEDSVYLAEEEARVATFTHSLLRLRQHEAEGRLLDVGCHVGTFLEVARRGRFEVAGVEPSEWAADHARRRGLEVYTGGLRDAAIADASFDVVTVWDVLEHFTDPMEELREIRRVLRPGGLVVLSTMNVRALAPRILGGRWPWYMLMHLYYFTPETLTRMLEQAGYGVEGIEAHVRVVSVRYLVSRLRSYSGWAYQVARWASEGLGLGGVRVPVTLGDLMTVYARKA